MAGAPAACPADLERYVREAFRTSARNYVDLFALRRLGPDRLEGLLARRGIEHLERAIASGRGVIVVSAHFGSFDGIGFALRAWPVPFTVLVERVEPPELLELYSRLRAVENVRFVPVSPGALLDVVRRLKKGEIVGLAIDRNVVGEGEWLSFFGAETPLPTGAATLAVRTGALLLPVFGIRRDDRFEISVEPPIEASRTGDTIADVRVTAQRVLTVIERYLRRWPGQWVVFEPVWQPGAA